MRYTKKGWATILSCILAIAFVAVVTIGVLLLTAGYFAKPERYYKAQATVYEDDLPFDVSVDFIEEKKYSKYGIESFDGEEAYKVTVKWTDKDNPASEWDGWSWSGSWDTSYDSDLEGIGGNGKYSYDMYESVDYAGDVWIEEGGPTGYSHYVDFEESVFSMDDKKFKQENIVLINEPFGTPVLLTFSVWRGDEILSATVRFDYKTSFISDDFVLCSGTREDYDVLFGAKYYGDSDEFLNSGERVEDIEYMYVSLEKVREEGSGIWYETQGAAYGIGTIAGPYDAENQLPEWDMEIKYNDKTYNYLSDEDADIASPADTTISGKTHSGVAPWDSISNCLFGTLNGTSDMPLQGFRYSDLRCYDRSVERYSSCQAMITLTIYRNGKSIVEIGLSFSDYDCIRVDAGGVDLEGGNTESGDVVAG